MSFNITEARKHLQAFDLKKLFIEEMGWDIARQSVETQVDSQRFQLDVVAQKRGLAVLVCSPNADGSIPDTALRSKIETQVRKIAHEHLIVFTNQDKSLQKWQWVRRELGRPMARREYDYVKGKKGEILLSRLQAAVFELEEEENLTIIEVGQRVRGAFDLERVTRRFYDRFKDEHSTFLRFIKGIDDKDLQGWYVSVTLNRLMFLYFVQKKNFLDNNPNYLRYHLAKSKTKGKDIYYREFLCPLFFEGFAKKDRTAKIKNLFGNIPYLNGGIFEQHQIEEMYGEKIQIPDEAFDQLYDFFDQYRWHLDERPLRADNEINPDVLGYIFEKYINQRQMGAYYTKEDITEYISKNTIIPYLFDVAKEECKVAFQGEGSIWRHLQADPDRYISAAIRHGVDISLPDEIALGLKEPERRENWNKPAPEQHALPTEIWREVIARRQRYQEVKEKLASGAITSIDELVKLNLDIRQFAQDVIEDSDADLLLAFWKALAQIRILDPTVGSGAFLFAALNILEPLYEACLERMSALVEELDRSGEIYSPQKYQPFRQALEQVRQRPDEDYFIYKSIIINNLYGVDIMEEAVEICKLRMFLKLASQVEPDNSKENLGIEPLPDIDFNIRPGNSLVGFAAREDVKRSVHLGNVSGRQAEKLFLMPEEDAQLQRIEEKAEVVDKLYKHFRQQQTKYGGEVRTEDKRELQERLGELEKELNVLLARQYAIHNFKGGAYQKWLASHLPFHWFVEFFSILQGGGFDVIIGNPPYVETNDVEEYSVLNFQTESCGDLYAYTLERAITLSHAKSRLGFIVPLSCFATDGFAALQKLYLEHNDKLYISNWSGDAHPSKLFEGVDKRLEIVLSRRQDNVNNDFVHTSKYLKWYSQERPVLFQISPYYVLSQLKETMVFDSSVPKLNQNIEIDILKKLRRAPRKVGLLNIRNAPHKLYYTRKVSFFLQFLDFVPEVRDSKGHKREPSELKELAFADPETRDLCLACLSSSMFYWYNIINSDCRNLNKREIISFPVPNKLATQDQKELSRLVRVLMESYKTNSELRTVNYEGKGKITVQYFNFRPSKPIIDKIDRTLARHYGLNDEEIDFIVNYDIKYRMGAELAN